MTRMHRSCPALPHRQHGAVIVLIVVALLAILAMAALALDGGHLLVNKTRLQNAVDAAALSGAKTLSKVSGDPYGYLAATDDAQQTLVRNAQAAGNAELARALADAGGVERFIAVEFAEQVQGPFSYPGPLDARYVRVAAGNYPLDGFFWGILQAFGGGSVPVKAVAAMATAGPSPTSAPCDLAPLVVCGVPQPGSYYGYRFGELNVLKTAANDEGISNGNYQLLDFGNGAKAVGEQLAGGGTLCPEIGRQVPTKPGNTVGPAISGLNTRMNEYAGSFKGSKPTYPPDLVVDYALIGSGNNQRPALSLDAGGTVVYGADNQNPGVPVSSDSAGNIHYQDPATASRVELFDYNDWKAASDACLLDAGQCTDGGVFERRILKVVVGNCTGLTGGATEVPVLGFGCFFLVQPGVHTGGDAQIFGQFISECEGDGVAGPNPVEDVGPQIIQLYKTYPAPGTPGTDS